ncbi:MAG: glycosyltransferase [Melioribacteraceae bacterium]|nr:glycosyltransferase [Melioribacteraceae bacterium]MCF8356119.1 glycosyltransferase [Melioribacteraceae bacterium]MCF8395901.1 glycosyltransferase [Melioribacteraceae bacterium]MCF8420993.1 glycosyltransferase [Melioribacteraceae bacterium]
MPKASVIIAFYNDVDYLKLVLAGFERQTFTGFEIIIADDGSNTETVSRLEDIIKSTPFKINHVWHEDKGWRKNKILNQAILAASGEYLIFIDGDCVPHKEFVKEHFENREIRSALTGRRVNLSMKMTCRLTVDNVKSGLLDQNINELIIDGLFGKSFDVEKGFYFKSQYLRNYFNKKKRGLLGCNFSLFKSDLLEINGFDERYLAPSIGEDSDVQFRLELIGTKIKSLNNVAIQFHLFHQIKPRPQKNLDLFEKIKSEGKSFTPFGINQNNP